MDNQEDRNVKVKLRPNWKFWYLSANIVLFIAAVIILISKLDKADWHTLFIIPVLISAITGVAISLVFTIKADKDRLTDELQREIDGVLERLLYLPVRFQEVMFNPMYCLHVKKQILVHEFEVMPPMYRIRRIYRELWFAYREESEKILIELEKWDVQSNSIKSCSDFQKQSEVSIMLHIHVMADSALIAQEKFYQDFKGESKRPIPEQLIFREKRKQKDISN